MSQSKYEFCLKCPNCGFELDDSYDASEYCECCSDEDDRYYYVAIKVYPNGKRVWSEKERYGGLFDGKEVDDDNLPEWS